eukprot:TRINITY_DN3933_c0_g3_i5.p1 TRINITY_DN3933_c0_g3~~TRINITY_DN3933_c0_g3_i5.p1  ORF type:complete len:404 (-),score=65.80 TRINITY_DN3933_c0_g3_i5:188-1399(-)
MDWSTALQWGVTQSDPRRHVWLQDLMLHYLTNPKSVQCQSQTLKFLSSLLQAYSWLGVGLVDKVLNILSSHHEYFEYPQMRREVTDFLTLVMMISLQPQRDSNHRIVLQGPLVLDSRSSSFLSNLYTSITSNQEKDSEKMKNLKHVTLDVMSQIIKSGTQIVIPFVSFVPLAFVLQVDGDEHLKLLGKFIVEMSSQSYVSSDCIGQFVDSLRSVSQKQDNWHIVKPLSTYLQIFVFNHSFLLSRSLLDSVFECIDSLLPSPQIEVAEAAQASLSSLLRTSGTETVMKGLIEKYVSMCNIQLPKKSQLKTKDGLTATMKVQHGLLGLSGIAQSQPYSVPEWLPQVLLEITKHSNSPRPLNKTVGNCLKEFWRTHQSEWIFLQHLFTEEQVDTIRQTTTSASYYA